MLTASNLALEVIVPTMALDGSLALGAYAEGACAEGKDFVCGERNGVHSCRPCDFAQLEQFRGLQGELNRIMAVDDPKNNMGKWLDIDGRMGPFTARALARVGAAVASKYPLTADVQKVVQACASAPDSTATHRLIATYVPELRAFFKGVADSENARKDYPEAPMPPESKPGGGAPVQVPIVEPDGGIVTAPSTAAAKSNTGAVLAVVAAVAGVGAAAWGYKRYRDRQGRRR